MNDCKDSCEELPKGIRGPRGYQGEKGDIGPKGNNGIAGPQGPQGTPGITGLTGAPGIGLTGPLGPQGYQGPAGTNGGNGTNGTNGLPGAKGETGAKGDDGDAGSAGDYITVTSPAVNDPLFKCGGIIVKQHDGTTDGVISSSNIINGCTGKDGRGVAVFIGGVTTQFVGGGANGEPTNAVYQATYSGVHGFTVNYVDETAQAMPGTYNANTLRPGDIWIKD